MKEVRVLYERRGRRSYTAAPRAANQQRAARVRSWRSAKCAAVWVYRGVVRRHGGSARTPPPERLPLRTARPAALSCSTLFCDHTSAGTLRELLRATLGEPQSEALHAWRGRLSERFMASMEARSPAASARNERLTRARQAPSRALQSVAPVACLAARMAALLSRIAAGRVGCGAQRTRNGVGGNSVKTEYKDGLIDLLRLARPTPLPSLGRRGRLRGAAAEAAADCLLGPATWLGCMPP